MRCYGTEYELYVRPRAERQCCCLAEAKLPQDPPTSSVTLNVSDSPTKPMDRTPLEPPTNPSKASTTHHTEESFLLPPEFVPGSGAILTTGDLGLDGGVVVLGAPGAKFLGVSAAPAAPVPPADGPGAPSVSLLSPLTTAMVFLKAIMTCPSPLPTTTPWPGLIPPGSSANFMMGAPPGVKPRNLAEISESSFSLSSARRVCLRHSSQPTRCSDVAVV